MSFLKKLFGSSKRKSKKARRDPSRIVFNKGGYVGVHEPDEHRYVVYVKEHASGPTFGYGLRKKVWGRYPYNPKRSGDAQRAYKLLMTDMRSETSDPRRAALVEARSRHAHKKMMAAGRDRSRAKRGPADQGMKLAKEFARWQPAGRRMKPQEKLEWREEALKRTLKNYGIPWRAKFHEVLVDQMIKEDHRSDHARYVRAYGSGR